MAYGVQQVVQQPREQTSLALRQPAFVISRSQLAGKQVITRTDGRILGVVDGLVADPDTCKIVAVSLIKSNALPGEERLQIGLLSLKQISDVLLVHDERAILREQLTIGLPYIQLVGKAVNTAGGKLVGKVSSGMQDTECPSCKKLCLPLLVLCTKRLASHADSATVITKPVNKMVNMWQLQVHIMLCTLQVRDFDFSPDDGQVTRLIIDGLGIPALPQRLQACQGVQIQLVQRVTWSCITLVPGVSEADIDKLTSGIFDSAISLLKV